MFRSMNPIRNDMKDVTYIGENELIVDDPKKYDGGSVGLLVIARRFEEEKLLEILETIAQTIGDSV